MDYRISKNRREAFVRWYSWSLFHKDCDPAVWCTNYLNDRFEHNDEQRLWFCWLYGNTYHLPTAWILMNEFPDFELATVDRITEWNSKNYTRLRYQTDTKWNKGHLPSMFESYKKFVGDISQREKLEQMYHGAETDNFSNIWNSVKENLYKFGRYSTWFYLQHLKHTSDIKIQPTSLMLNDYSGSKSHRNGLLYALGQDDKVNAKLTKSEYEYLEKEASSILEETKCRFPELINDIDFFTMETCLCSFRKIFRNHHTRFLGYYLARQKEEIEQVELDGWFGIDWNVLWQARNETLDERLLGLSLTRENKNNSLFLQTGKITEPWETAGPVNLEKFFT